MAGLQSAITSILPFAPLIQQGVDLISGTASAEASAREAQQRQQLALQQLRETQRLQERQTEQDATLARERIAAEAAAAENDRQRALRRAVARQRAQFGAQGISTNNGSAQAILLGLFDESEEELAERQRLDGLRNAALDLDVSQQRGLNLLQREQLRQRQNLSRFSSVVGRGSNILNFGAGALDIARQLQET